MLAKAFVDAIGDIFDHSGVGVDDENGEFVATVTGGDISRATLFLHDAGETLESAVAGQVTESVVDALEVVQIEQKEAEGLMAAVGAADFRFEMVKEFAIVGEAGEPVVGCLIADSSSVFLRSVYRGRRRCIRRWCLWDRGAARG